jgi:hypothetical protein
MGQASAVAVARRLSFVRETAGANRGAWVEFMQRFCDGVPGDSWCADFVSLVLDVAYHGRPPLRPTGSTRAMLAEATAKGMRLPAGAAAAPEDLYFYLGADGAPHHVGIVTTAGQPPIGIAGNTSEDGSSPNGTGVFEHGLPPGARVALVRLPRGDA